MTAQDVFRNNPEALCISDVMLYKLLYGADKYPARG